MKSRLTIGFLAETSNDKFRNELLSGAIEASVKNDINLIKFSIDSLYKTYTLHNQIKVYSDLLQSIHLDGLMCVGYYHQLNNYDKIKQLIKHVPDIPFVSIGKIIDKIPSIYMNGAIYIKKIVKHLVKNHQCKKIYFAPPFELDDREEAFIEIMKEYGLYKNLSIIPIDKLINTPANDFNIRAKNIISALFNKNTMEVDAILSMYSHEAIELIKELKKIGYSVPGDIAVTGWEDGDLGKYFTPSLTTVYYPFYELGYKSLEKLLSLINHDKIPDITYVQGRVIYRQSCGCTLNSLQRISSRISGEMMSTTNTITHQNIKEIEKNLHLSIKDPFVLELFNTLKQSMEDKNIKSFISYCEKIINDKNTIEELYSLNNDIYTIRGAFLKYLTADLDHMLLSNDIWLTFQELIKEKIIKIIGINGVNQNFQSLMLQDIVMDITSVFDLERLSELLTINLKKIKIPECYLFLCNPEIELIYTYQNNEQKAEKHNLDVLTKSGLHDLLFYNNKNHIYILHILHIHQDFIGFAFFEPGPKNERLYQTLSNQLSSAIAGTLTLNKLKDAQTEILKNIKIIEDRTKELEESNKKLEMLDNIKNDFIANITHDFRSPLMVILNISDLALTYGNNNNSELVHKRFHLIYDSSIKIKANIDRLLDIAKMDSQGIKIKVKKVNLKKFLENLINFYKSSVLNSNIKIIEVLPFHEIEDFYTDEEKLEDILNNIFSNALKYVNQENGKIVIELVDGEHSIKIIISDNGIGIPKNQLTAIFNRFNQLEDEQSIKHKWTGIGLAYSKQLIEYLKGSIKAESEGLDKGSRFILELKKGRNAFNNVIISNDEPDQINKNRENLARLIKIELNDKQDKNEITTFLSDLNKEECGEFDYLKGIILIVDDSKQIRNIIIEYCVQAGYKNFIEASDGLQGIEAAYKYRPDMIICDYNMPNMGGNEFHDELINNPDFKQIPFIFVTAIADKKILIERKRKGALSYLIKPVDKADLLATVEAYMKKYMEFKITLQLATIDTLTGLSNRNNITKTINAMLTRQHYSHLSLIFFDLDHFKKFNDCYGHQTGDKILNQVGERVNDVVRNCDLAGRYGGEEFIILLPDIDINQAYIIAKRIQQEINTIKIPYKNETLSITASYGIASLIDNATYICNALNINAIKDLYDNVDNNKPRWTEMSKLKQSLMDILIKIVDMALYKAKSTICKNCGFQSLQADMFPGSKCQKCNSTDLIMGRNRIVRFDE